MTKANKKINKPIFLIATVLVLFAGLIAYQNIKQKDRYPIEDISGNRQPAKTYQSKSLKVSLTVPQHFKIVDEEIRILISNTEGTIIVTRNGTQFESLAEYLKDFDLKRKAQVSNERFLTINNYPAASRIIKHAGSSKNGDKIYLIYVNNAVYQAFTETQSLFDELDQIAQSFQYTP